MRVIIGIICGATLLALSGCAAAMPGYAPPNSRTKLPIASAKSAAEPQAPAVLATDGTYVPSSKEQSLSCRRLTGVVQIKIQQVRDIEAHPTTGLVTTITSTATPRHTAAGQPSAAYSEERAKLIALNKLMADKKCGQFDLEAALAPGNTKTPEPIYPDGKRPKKSR
jgi:hypothetical protein